MIHAIAHQKLLLDRFMQCSRQSDTTPWPKWYSVEVPRSPCLRDSGLRDVQWVLDKDAPR